MSKKTLTTSEALKANETKRVRAHSEWFEVGQMTRSLDAGLIDVKKVYEWEAEEPLIERWAIYWQDIYQCCFPNENEAVQFLKDGSERIVHLREVRP